MTEKRNRGEGRSGSTCCGVGQASFGYGAKTSSLVSAAILSQLPTRTRGRRPSLLPPRQLCPGSQFPQEEPQPGLSVNHMCTIPSLLLCESRSIFYHEFLQNKGAEMGRGPVSLVPKHLRAGGTGRGEKRVTHLLVTL